MKRPYSENPSTRLRESSTAIRLSIELMAHVDREREHVGLSRAAMIRQIIAEHMRRSAPSSRGAAQP